jgi:hypothetical protein
VQALKSTSPLLPRKQPQSTYLLKFHSSGVTPMRRCETLLPSRVLIPTADPKGTKQTCFEYMLQFRGSACGGGGQAPSCLKKVFVRLETFCVWKRSLCRCRKFKLTTSTAPGLYGFIALGPIATPAFELMLLPVLLIVDRSSCLSCHG